MRGIIADSGRRILLIINEALCSSCTVKPEKFQAKQENMMASMRKRGVCHISLARFSQDLNSEKWIQFHASCIIKGFLRDREDGKDNHEIKTLPGIINLLILPHVYIIKVYACGGLFLRRELAKTKKGAAVS